jgi:DinB superfamily
MASTVAADLRTKIDAARANLFRQLDGLESHLEKSDAPGQWTAREVLSHLSFERGFDAVATLRTFTTATLPVIEIDPGQTHLDAERRTMTLAQFRAGLDKQRGDVLAYLDSLSAADLQHRKARIPLFKQLGQSEEVPIAAYVGVLFDYHWNDHAGQIAKIRKAAGLPEAK